MDLIYNKTETEREKAILVCADIGEYDVEISLSELEELAATAGAEVVGRAVQKRDAFNSATCVGSGFLEDLKGQCAALEAELAIFDCELTGTQLRNISDALEIRVVDRTTLILDIFAQRAVTREGKVQVELAQQQYMLPRLMGQGQALSRLGGGIGTRGPGESKLEADRRHIRRRISTLERDLEELSKNRNFLRSRRKKSGLPAVALVGYTNSGKSTLLNALTDAGVLAEDKLFATLDTVSRGITLPDGRTALLTDTVGFIRRLPHKLVEAFKSTLEEAASCDLIVNLIDASSSEASAQCEVTRELLSELGCDGIPRLDVYNKTDLLSEPLEGELCISAKKSLGLDALLDAIAKALEPTSLRMKLLIPYSEAALLSRIRAEGKLFAEEYKSDGIFADALVDRRLVNEASPYVCEDEA